MLAVVGLGAAPAAARRIAVAVDGPREASSLALVDARPPWTAETDVAPLGPDSVLFGRYGLVYALSRKEGSLRVIDPDTGSTLHVVELGADDDPRDVVVVRPDRAYVSRRGSTHLLRVDPTTGESREVVDLGVLADPDGIPDMERMTRYRRFLFVQLGRRNGDFPFSFQAPAMLAVVDLRTESLVDVDPIAPGVQGIALDGTPPRFRMQLARGRRRLYVSATGGFFDHGGIEEVDLTTLESLGLIVAEVDGESGADTGSFVLTSASGGYLIFSTDLLLSSHLVRFIPRGGVVSNELHLSLETFIPVLLHRKRLGLLYLIDGGAKIPGLFVFHAGTGERIRDGFVATGGEPVDAIFIRRPRSPQALAPR